MHWQVVTTTLIKKGSRESSVVHGALVWQNVLTSDHKEQYTQESICHRHRVEALLIIKGNNGNFGNNIVIKRIKGYLVIHHKKHVLNEQGFKKNLFWKLTKIWLHPIFSWAMSLNNHSWPNLAQFSATSTDIKKNSNSTQFILWFWRR